MNMQDPEVFVQNALTVLETEGQEYEGLVSAFLGTVFALDPCGRYHHFLSGDAPETCAEWWARVEDAADQAGFYIRSGRDDPCDIFAERPGG